ncbi:hypothetical protein NXF25_004361 [Crotalus adamanteus]|uniref:Alpha/beta hydrolase fold-3 domain-containing protein n=1 Tax=Crotalus adamanteus TaxID=8729 RepID=A0AAW1BVT1_CROAD
MAEDAVIQQFPETFLLTCEYDIFRDDGLLYKKRLEDNGVPVTWLHLKDGFHGITLLIDMGSIQFPDSFLPTAKGKERKGEGGAEVL